MSERPDSARVVNVDLSDFSLGHDLAWAHPIVIFLGMLAWFMFLGSVAVGGAAQLALILGALTILLVFVGFLGTTIQRMFSSTAGQSRAFVRRADLNERPPHFVLTIGESIERVARLRAQHAPADARTLDPRRRSKRVRASLYIILGILLVVAGIPLVIASRPGALLAPAIILLIVLMYALFTRARRIVAPSADLLSEHDKRSPILFLRSFQDDQIKLKQRVRLVGAPADQPLRFEEALGLIVRGFGPFVAIGEPGEGLPQLGAARAYYSDDKWQEAVLTWIRSARLIVMVAGPTPWIRWELRNVIMHERLKDLVLLLPPGRTEADLERRVSRWKNVAESLAGTPFESALKDVDVREALLIQFRPDGRIVVYSSAHDLVQDYELATTLAIDTALQASDKQPSLELAELGASESAHAQRRRRHREPVNAGVLGLGAWLVVQGITTGVLFNMFVRYVMSIPANYRSTGLWIVVCAVYGVAVATSLLGLGAFLQKRRFRIPGIILCAIGCVLFSLLSSELLRTNLNHVRPQDMIVLFAPVFVLGYLAAIVILWRWRPSLSTRLRVEETPA